MNKTGRSRWILFCVATLTALVVGCAQSGKRVEFKCEPVLQISPQVLELRIISIGEVHGVSEVPAMVGSLACQLVKQGKPVMLGLEMTSGAQASVDRFLVSPGAAEDRSQMLANSFWNGRDGRASLAMVDLVDYVRRMRAAGLDVGVLAFDVDSSNGASDSRRRDQVMADNIATSVRQQRSKTFVLLSGNYHASKQKDFSHDAKFQSMAYLLSLQFPVTTFNADYVSGTAWNCRGRNAAEMKCGSVTALGFAGEETAPHITLQPAFKRPAYFPSFDGSLFVGREVSASPPALPH